MEERSVRELQKSAVHRMPAAKCNLL